MNHTRKVNNLHKYIYIYINVYKLGFIDNCLNLYIEKDNYL